MFEAYRVKRKFQWDGWIYAPHVNRGIPGRCNCDCADHSPCTSQVGTGCGCAGTICHCDCGIPAHLYAGDIWIVMAGHPRKENMLLIRMAVPDPSIPHIDELLSDPKFKRLTGLPEDAGVIPEPTRRPDRVATPT